MDAGWPLSVLSWVGVGGGGSGRRWRFVGASRPHSVDLANGRFLVLVKRPKHGVVGRACGNSGVRLTRW